MNMTNDEFDAKSHIASIDERVSGLERAVEAVARGVRELSQEIRQSTKTQWPAIIAAGSLAVTVITAIGLLAYLPIQQKQGDLDRALLKIVDSMVTQRETTIIREHAEKDTLRHEKRLDRMEEFVFRNFPPTKQ